MPDPADTPSSAAPSPFAGENPKASRRRLLQGALATAPVLMTLVSRPVLAHQCQTPSGFVSGDGSAARGAVGCLPQAPQYWIRGRAPPHRWWSAGLRPPREFDSVFA